MMCDSVMHPFPLMILSLDVRRSWLTKAWKMKMVLVKKARMRSTKSYQILKMCSNSMETAPGACFFCISKYFTSSDPHPDILFWHAFWHYIWHTDILSDINYILTYSDIFYLTDILSDIYSDILSGIYSDILYMTSCLAVEIRQCPLSSGARGWGPAVPTEICSSQLKQRRSGGDRRASSDKT